ncbi:hypothetical protein SAMN04488550_4129 [Gordonia malaquae]|uniref:Major capsid protein n=1 Tax=Gordonia malaquae NBRC 108250 TaxID=1223542 RepID=M3TIA0_GORML|nr:major capsid protein [Gordonia malaquae]GAC81231.1 hypothetical protein GM1_030_00600 [Gordonia malaquae NBRC 108250]SEE24246.1 hypothetical protein SAMN04488550_4129 [Gordonia malaquae]
MSNAIQYPLAAPTLTGNDITVDLMLKEPTRITRYLSDLTLKGYFADRIFANGGGTSGGAVVFDQLTKNDLFVKGDRDVQQVAPGAEFPIVDFERQKPRTAQVEKFGGKFFVTDEARDRNDNNQIQVGTQRLANTIQRKIHARALGVLNAEMALLGASAQTYVGKNWGAVVTSGASQTSAQGWPAADLAAVQLIADEAELGVQFSLWIVNPVQKSAFQTVYGNQWKDVLSNWGVDMIASNQVEAGTAWVVAERQVGEQRLEKPLSTETWREQETERTWVQSSVRPVFVVTNPFSVVKVTGLQG